MERAWPFLASALAVLLSGASSLVASPSTTPPAPEPPVHPVRIVALGIPADELALALVAPERIVALDRFADDPDASNVVEQARAVAGRVAVDLEQVLAREPDLVLVPAWAGAELELGLHRFGIATVRVGNATSVEGVRENVRRVAEALDAGAEGRALLATMDAALERARARGRGGDRPTVVLHAGSGYSPGAHTLFAELVEAAGGRTLLAELGDEGLAPLSIEREMSLDPDVVIVDAYRADARTRELAGLTSFGDDRRFAHLRAVRSERVVPIAARFLLTTTHHVAETVTQLANALHGDGSP
jgi:iron complex transport system substrate-binding protein